MPVDYESLQELGAIMGSGGLIVMDEDTCMVDMARFFLDFVQDESCGKCPPCRIGTKRMLEIVNRICDGHGVEGDIERLEELGRIIRETSLCGLGQTAPNPVLSTIRYFRAEYEAHIREKRCPAGVCPNLVRAPCQSACPANVDVPGFIALVSEKRIAEALRLHRERNPFAAVCARVCFHTCEDKCRRGLVDEALSIRGVKRFMVDEEVTTQLPEVRPNATNATRKIAIVGAGPAGLSCAYFLARLGYRPRVFEGESRPGGMPVQTIPAYRLPREILSLEVRMIERMGVTIETNQRLGRDFTLQGLRDQGYEAVFLGVGAPAGLHLGVPGEDFLGVDDAIRFLREYNIRGSAPIGRDVVVVGGGNAAIDTARSAVAARRAVGHGALPPYPRGDAGLHRGNRGGRTRGRGDQGADGPGRDRGQERPGVRHQVPDHDAGRIRPQRPPPAQGRGRGAFCRARRPGHHRHRPEARTRGAHRRPAGLAQQGRFHRRRSTHRAHFARMALQRRRRGAGTIVGGRGGRRRRARRRRRSTPSSPGPNTPSGEKTRRATCVSTRAPSRSDTRAPGWDVLPVERRMKQLQRGGATLD